MASPRSLPGELATDVRSDPGQYPLFTLPNPKKGSILRVIGKHLAQSGDQPGSVVAILTR